MYRGDAMGRLEPCLDFTFDIGDGPFDPSPVSPGLTPRDLSQALECGDTIVGAQLSSSSPHSLYRTTDLVTNTSYFARFFHIQVDDVGDYLLALANVHGFTPYVTVHRSGTIQWQGVLDGGEFDFSVTIEQTGPMVVEITTVDRYDQGSFDITLNCPATVEVFYDEYIGNIGWLHRFAGDVLGGDNPMITSASYVYELDIPDPVEWLVTAGSLPPGLLLNSSSGRLEGTPTTIGDYTFTAKFKKDGVVKGSKVCLCKVRGPLQVDNISDVKDWIETIGGFPVNSLDGVLRVIGVSSDDEELWRWEGKGFLDSSYPAGFRGITLQLNGHLPRTFGFFSNSVGGTANYTKTDMLPSPIGTYNLSNGGFFTPEAPLVITIS